MNYQEKWSIVIKEIVDNLQRISEDQVRLVLMELKNAKRIFLDGRGRSGLMTGAFAVRLAQMGKEVYVPEQLTTPSIRKGDLLLICSASGETSSLVLHANTAKKVGARVLLLTANEASTIAGNADFMIPFRSGSKYGGEGSAQVMGSLFEQTVFLFFEALTPMLMEQLQISAEEMQARHNTLE